MKDFLHTWGVIFAMIVAFIGLFWNRCQPEKPEITRTVDTLYIESKDPEHNITPTVQPSPTYITNNYTYEAAKGPIDTGAVLRDYFTKRGYQDTIRNDSIDVILHEETYKNELTRKKVSYRWKAPERIIKEKITETKFKKGLYIGPIIGWNYDRQNNHPYGLGIGAVFSTNKFTFYSGFNPIQRNFSAGFFTRIKWQK